VNAKGQAFTLYKMLISVIFIFLILMIIISAINYFENLRLDVSTQRVIKAMNEAAKQPNSDILKVEDVSIKKGTAFTAEALSEVSGLEPDCLTFDAFDYPSVELDTDNYVRTTESLSTTIYIRCASDPAICTPCTICCLFSLGKEIS